ncbi:hypothetical protein R1flu_004584 [Riccia fluitans]|uniref:Uncharacterized protein n=1 Tax=Riccia fluitans TaxID=41844 RepID=A0ABD1YR38_9MARC
MSRVEVIGANSLTGKCVCASGLTLLLLSSVGLFHWKSRFPQGQSQGRLLRAVSGSAGKSTGWNNRGEGIHAAGENPRAVGVCIAAFARAVLEGSTKPGVWYPEEDGGIRVEDREKLLECACKGTINYIMNK